MSFKEKSIWVSLIIMLIIWMDYFSDVYNLYQSASLTVAVIHKLLLGVVVLTIILQIIFHTVIAIIDKKGADEHEDERDKVITLYGSRNAYLILSIGVVVFVFQTILPSLFDRSNFVTGLPDQYVLMHVVIIAAVIAEVVKYSTQLFYYRQGS